MQAKRVLAAVIAVTAVLAAAWLLLDRDRVPSAPAANAAVAAPEVAPAAATVASASGEQPAAAPADTATPERHELALADPKLAVVRGRCLDATGAPLAGCTVRLHGWEANSERVEQWQLEHGDKPTWKDLPPQTTGDDGRFRFAFWPPPPFQFTLDVNLDNHGTMSGRWSTLKEGTDTDVGDVTLGAGVRVRGRIVDEGGAPQAKAYVMLWRQDGGRMVEGAVRANWGSQARSQDDGTFEQHAWLCPGLYEVGTQTLELVSPKTLTLAADRPAEVVTVVVKRPPATVTITGRVLDESGAPAPEVTVVDRSAQGSASARTERNGAFELQRRADSAGTTARLQLSSNLYEIEADDAREVAWGTTGVEFRVARAGALTLRVTDEAEAPVETYTVRLVPRTRSGWSSNDSRARAQGRHPDGTVVIDGLARGDWLLVVDFATASGLESLFEPFRHEAIGPRRMDMRAQRSVGRTLRVIAADDEPVAGSKVQLCELFGGPLDQNRLVMQRDTWLMNSGDHHAMILFEGETDAGGRLQLRGPGGRALGLCLLGPGHVPLRQAGARLDIESELVVRVSRGARLIGKVIPPEAVAELKRLADADPTGSFPKAYRPRLELIGMSGPALPHTVTAARDLERLFFNDDGAFDIDGLPPGTWDLRVKAWIISGHSGGSSHMFDAGTATLVDGQTLHHDLDLQAILPGTVEAMVLLNGLPFANGAVTLQCEHNYKSARTDAEGRFTCSCFPGVYEVRAQLKNKGDTWSQLQSPERVRVVRGETTRQTVTLSSGRLQVTLRDAAGKPVADAVISVRIGEGGAMLPATGSDGRSEGEFAAGSVVLRILPKQLSTPEAQQKLWSQATPGGGDPFAPHRITLATVVLSPGQVQQVELKLPADSGY